jgi:aryl-alcohol dehydrogenase-like predicted oxidoreductase
MEHFTFGRNNGLRVSALALGAGSFGSRWGYGADPDYVPTIFDRFADAGGTFIDTAASYQLGEAEENLGRLLHGRRDSFTIATKFAIGGPEGTGVLQTGNGRRAMFRSVEGSLRRLGTDYIDLLWVHFPDLVTPIEEIGAASTTCARRQDPLRRVVESPGVDVRACGVWPNCEAHPGFGGSAGVQPRRTQR